MRSWHAKFQNNQLLRPKWPYYLKANTQVFTQLRIVDEGANTNTLMEIATAARCLEKSLVPHVDI